MGLLLLTLLILISIWLIGGLCDRPLTLFVQQYWPKFSYEGEQFLLWGGLLLSGFGIGLLLLYLVLGL
ncbi:hypothetical protein BH10CHL1_BH10CHL1_28360 [soil metagenome]